MDYVDDMELLDPSGSECLDALSRFISCLSGYDETALIPKDSALFLRKLRLEYSDAASKDASMRLLHQAHSAAVALARSFQDGLAYLSGQKVTVHGATIQLKKTSGIDALPDDIIAMVAEQVKKNTDQEMVIRFSHVCQRWRNVALSFPQLWCSPSPSLNRTMVQTLLARSRLVPLDIVLHLESGAIFNNFLQYFDDVKPHFGRCRLFKLFLGLVHIESETLRFTKDLGANCDGLHAPALETLDIDYRALIDRHTSRDARLHFYASWHMPQLRSLRITNFIPRPVFGNSLKSLKAEFDDPGWEKWDMQEFLNFLATIPQLEELSIILRNSAFFFFESPQGKPMVLENVTCLTLDIAPGRFDTCGTLRTVLRWIITPNITELKLSVNVDALSEINDLLDLVFSEDRCINVERFDFHIRQFSKFCGMQQIFFQLPRLSDLSISMYNGSDDNWLWALPSRRDGYPPGKSLPPLRSIRLSGFKDIPSFRFDDPSRLAYAMEDGQYWEQLERMEIVGCSSFERSKDQLEETIPRGKLLWID